MDKKDENDIMVEYVKLGNTVKVTAIDPVSMREAVVIGPASASRDHMSQLAVRKLAYLLGKDEGE